eukprot:7601259-Ditylum_brightwellii.AAC.1
MQDILRRVTKEAVGVKRYDTLEIVCRNILLKPSLASVRTNIAKSAPASAVHAIISSLLRRIRDRKVDSSLLGKVKECMNRIVIGISHNSSTDA